jgi:hypothetical protein
MLIIVDVDADVEAQGQLVFYKIKRLSRVEFTNRAEGGAESGLDSACHTDAQAWNGATMNGHQRGQSQR